MPKRVDALARILPEARVHVQAIPTQDGTTYELRKGDALPLPLSLSKIWRIIHELYQDYELS
jgi:hypothetical protein